jgi:hypothetical protein
MLLPGTPGWPELLFNEIWRSSREALSTRPVPEGTRMNLIERLKAWESIAARYPDDMALVLQNANSTGDHLRMLRTVAIMLRRKKPAWATSQRLGSLATTLDEAADEIERLALKRRGSLN